MACYFVCRLDHFFDGKTDTISKVENIAFAAVTQIMQGEDVGLGKIVDMDVVPDTGAAQFPGDGLKDVFGVISEEIDTFYPTDRNQVTLWDGSKAQVRDYAELLRVQENVRILEQYDADFYQGMPAVTEHSYGEGTVYYVAARMETQVNRRILELLVSRSGLDLPKLPEGVEYHVREAGGERYIFLLNLEEKEKQIDGIHGTDLLTQKICDGTVKLEPYGVMVVKEKQG